jgi:hypothetical protein
MRHDRRELVLGRVLDAYDDDSATHRAARSNAADRDFGRINAKYGSTFGTRNVHVLSSPLRARMATSCSRSIAQRIALLQRT